MPKKRIKNSTKIDFGALPWQKPAPGVRFKAAGRNGRKLRLVEFTRAHSEKDWCREQHIGWVLQGELEITFADRTERYRAGDGIFILGGSGEKHRARVISYRVRLVLVEKE